jgi:hypothetical protein
VAQAYNPSYSGGRNKKDRGSFRTNSSIRPYLSQKKKPSQKTAGGAAQGVGPEFKPQYCKKKKKKRRRRRTRSNLSEQGRTLQV